MARLSTHVLDTSRGAPVEGLVIDLHACVEGQRRHLKADATDANGRLLLADELPPGVYELTFHAGDYFRAAGVALAGPPFLDEVVVRFGVADPSGNYHVPLLLSPYGYSTYRGS
jgi:5-hydroxyisourate hydrolase